MLTDFRLMNIDPLIVGLTILFVVCLFVLVVGQLGDWYTNYRKQLDIKLREPGNDINNIDEDLL